MANGDRVTFLVQLNQAPGNYQIRVANDGLNQVVSGFGVLSYKGASANTLSGQSSAVLNYGGGNLTLLNDFNPILAAPYPPVKPATSADATFVLDIMKAPQSPASWAWTLSGVSSYNQSRDDETPPLLFQNPANIPASDLILKTQSGQWVDLIIKVAGPLAEPHPMHKHANKFYMIGAGTGDFNWTTTAQAAAAGVPFNLATAPYLDGFTSIPAEGSASWMVWRYQVDTPGAWFLHCHVQTHFSGGMAVAILDGIDNFPQTPSDAGKVCPGNGQSSYTGGWGNGSSSGSGSGSWSGSGNGGTSGSGSGSGAFVTTSASAGGPTATGSATVATYTGAASAIKTTSLTAVFGVIAAVFAFCS